MHDAVVPFPRPMGPTRSVRSTLLCASIQALRSRGYYDAYLAALSPADRVDAAGLTAGQWLPISRACIHYAACDAIPLTYEARFEIGAAVGKRVQETVLAAAGRLSREVGATPWTLLAQAERFRELNFQGGGASVAREGPKDALVDWQLQPCARFTHFRAGFAGVVQKLLGMAATRLYVKDVTPRAAMDRLVLAVAWA